MKEAKLIKSAFMGLQTFKHTVISLRTLRHQRFALRSLLGVDMGDEQTKGLLLGKAHEPVTPTASTVSEGVMFDDEEAMEEQHEQF